MDQSAETTILDELLDPLAESFTPEVAKRVAEYRADPKTQALLDDFAERANEGSLTDVEKEQYHFYIRTLDLIAILKAKAKQFLASKHSG